MKTKDQRRNQPPLPLLNPNEGNPRAPLLGRGGAGGGATLRLGSKPHLWRRKPGNKARMSMKTKGRYLWLAQTLLLNVCDAPKAQVGEIVPLAPTCPFGTSQTPHFGVCANLRGG